MHTPPQPEEERSDVGKELLGWVLFLVLGPIPLLAVAAVIAMHLWWGWRLFT